MTAIGSSSPGTGGTTYDSDNRLTALPWSNETFGFDAIGTITTLNGIAQTYHSGSVQAPSAVGGVGFGYAGGFLTSDGVRTYSYDLENHLTSVSKGAQTQLSYVYDYDGRRLKRTDATGTSIAPRRYTAFGSVLSASGTFPTDRGFTGQIRDGSATNWEFYFYQSRYYNAAIGKFVQPDSVVPDQKNAQALNDPPSRVDPVEMRHCTPQRPVSTAAQCQRPVASCRYPEGRSAVNWPSLPTRTQAASRSLPRRIFHEHVGRNLR